MICPKCNIELNKYGDNTSLNKCIGKMAYFKCETCCLLLANIEPEPDIEEEEEIKKVIGF